MKIELTEESIKAYLTVNYAEDGLLHRIDEASLDYLDDDWEDEYSDEHEAYQETGRGEAESQVRAEIQEDILKQLNINHVEFETKIGKNIWEVITEVFDCLDG